MHSVRLKLIPKSMKVILSDYTPEWVNFFQKEKKIITDKLGDKIVTVEHIGSTAVPGLGTKPIIDILLGVRKISDADEFIPKMEDMSTVTISSTLCHTAGTLPNPIITTFTL